MFWQLIIPGFLVGLAGSLHCIGMCGPLALALPFPSESRLVRITCILLYNSGRILAYSILGLLFGLAGRRIYLAGIQQWFSILLGIAVLLLIIRYYIFHRVAVPFWLQPFYWQLQRVISILLKSRRLSSFMLLGFANGFLPCGMVYLAIAGALMSQQVLHSVLFMGSFGFGTLPVMITVGMFGLSIKYALRNKLRKAIPYIATAMALLLIARGLNLGIPFISPVLAGISKETLSCH